MTFPSTRCTTLIPSLLLAVAALTATSGCDERNPATPADPGKRLTTTPLTDVDSVQVYLSKLWERSNHTEWDTISAMINAATGGTVEGVPASWPAGYEFRLEIPAGAITRRGMQHVEYEPLKKRDPEPVLGSLEISILVPRNNGQDHPPVYHLLPHGLVFYHKVAVTFCYPPWHLANEYYAKFFFWEASEYPPSYQYSDLEVVYPEEGGELRTNIRFDTWHFSRWGMDNGSGGEEDLLPGRPNAPPFPLGGWP